MFIFWTLQGLWVFVTLLPTLMLNRDTLDYHPFIKSFLPLQIYCNAYRVRYCKPIEYELCQHFHIIGTKHRYLNKTLAPLEVSQRRKRKFTRASKGPTFSVDFFTLCGFFNRHLAAALAFRSG